MADRGFEDDVCAARGVMPEDDVCAAWGGMSDDFPSGFPPISDDEYESHADDLAVDDEYESHADDPSLEELPRPWTLLGQMFEPLVDPLRHCWWDNIGREAGKYMLLERKEKAQVLVAGPTSSDQRAVGTVFTRDGYGAVAHDIKLHGCAYKCPTMSRTAFSSLTKCVTNIVSRFVERTENAVILCPKRTDHASPDELFGARRIAIPCYTQPLLIRKCWWGDIGQDAIKNHMTSASPGQILVAGPILDDPGIVCSIYVRTEEDMIVHNIVLCGCMYYCPTVTLEEFYALDSCMLRVILSVQNRVVLSPRRDYLNGPYTLPGIPYRVIDGITSDTASPLDVMVAEIADLPDASNWFMRGFPEIIGPLMDGISDTHQDAMVAETAQPSDSSEWPMRACHFARPRIKFSDIRQVSTEYGYHVLVYNISRTVAGYMFDIISSNTTMTVTFNQRLGYCADVAGRKTHHQTLKALFVWYGFEYVLCLHRMDATDV